ncbi:MAG: MFS transporter [Chloroflexi bacterium]|nr:MFS transporter [Chloroflexota bacterium]
MFNTHKLHLFDALQFRRYRFFWVSAILVYAARWIQFVVLGWLVLERTNSAFLVGMAGAFQWLPMLVLGLFTGAVADRLNRRLILIAVQVFTALMSLLLGFLIVTNAVQTWQIMVITLLVGFAWALDWPCRQTIQPDLAGEKNVLNAIALDHTAANIMSILGSVAGGQLITAIGMGNAYYLIGAMYVIAALFLIGIGGTAQSRPPQNYNIKANVIEGIRCCLNNQAILGVLIISLIIHALIFPFRQLLPVFARDILRVGPEGLGYLSAAPGIGSTLGSILLASRGQVRRVGPTFIGGAFVLGSILTLFAFSKIYSLSLTSLAAFGLAVPFFGTLQSAILLRLTEYQMRGRVMGVLSLAIGAMPLGILVFGAIADTIGAPLVVGASALLSAILVGVIFFTMPALRKQR